MELLPTHEVAGREIFATEDSRRAYLAIPICLLIVTAMFVSIRLSSNYMTVGRLLFEDYIAALAVLFVAATFLMADIGLKQLAELESGSPTTLTSVEAANRSTIIFILASASTIASKTPILFLYIRLFGSERWLRVCSYATLVSSAVILGAGVIAVGAVCIRRHEGAVAETRCRNYWDRAWVACGSTSLGADLVVLALPLPIIAKLRLPTRKKLGLALVFASGIFAIAATTVALYYKIEASLNGVMVAWAVGMTWSNVEWCISVMVGCVPSVYTFWSTVVTKSKFYMKVSKTFSDISCSFSRSQCSRGRPRTLDDESTRRITEREPSNGGGSIEMTRTNTNGGFAV